MRNQTFVIALALVLWAPGLRAQEWVIPQDSAQTLHPGDVIRLRIWREPEMSGDFLVDETGTVIFPRLGEYMVLEDTDESLQARLLESYQRYLRNPSIEIRVLRRIRITGAVSNPGLHLVDATYTIADALALAGGATPIGQPDEVRIVREGQQIAVDLRQDTRIIDSPIRSGDHLFVPERGWVSRNSGVVAAAISGAISIVVALLVR